MTRFQLILMTKPSTDHFSAVAANYAQYRPRYPAALFHWLANQAPARNLAWDCAAGSGQASIDLAAHFRQVIATDISAAQLDAAPAGANIRYRVAPAEDSGLASHSVDLICVAQALHWFDLERFYTEVNRVLTTHGILAVWTYGLFTLEGSAVNDCITHFYQYTVDAYWPPERVHVANGYRDLPFPFHECTPPEFHMHTQWNLEQVLGYLRSWSASSRYQQHTGMDPVAALRDELAPLWGEPGQERQIRWPLALRIGRNNSA